MVYGFELGGLHCTVFGVTILRNEFYLFARYSGGGRVGYGTGSCFLMNFKTVFQALGHDLHFVQCYIWGNTPTVHT